MNRIATQTHPRKEGFESTLRSDHRPPKPNDQWPTDDGLESVDLAEVKVDPVWTGVLTPSAARRFHAVGLCRVGREVVIATSLKQTDELEVHLSSHLSHPYRLVRADEKGVRKLVGQVYPPTSRPGAPRQTDESIDAVQRCDDLFRAALLRGASDIHLIPGEDSLQSRFRVDGILEDYRSYASSLQAAMVSRIKVLAGLNIAEKRQPQDGRFTTTVGESNQRTDVRVATIPTRHGERVTLRLLTPRKDAPSLSELGMSDVDHQLFGRAMACSNGLVLLTGPTGCGKSTTLYTAIAQLLRLRGGNIITVEDPIEYEIPGTTQVEVDPAEKVSFARALRSILRHDPDIIMLGEIRDAETAELAMKASLTGHLVFSTLHTNTAAGAVTRLLDLGVEPFLIAATLRLAVAQRLVRRLCPRCRVESPLDESDAASLADPSLLGSRAFQSAGCVYCAGKGFLGRTALFEMLPASSELSRLIHRQATEQDLIEQMQQSGRPLLEQDGIRNVLDGTTTARQVMQAVTVW